jgi:hypothetical protein
MKEGATPQHGHSISDCIAGGGAEGVVRTRLKPVLANHVGYEQLAGERLQRVRDGIRTVEQHPLEVRGVRHRSAHGRKVVFLCQRGWLIPEADGSGAVDTKMHLRAVAPPRPS